MNEWLANNIAIVIAILSHAGATIWFASKLNTTVTGMGLSLSRIDKELEKRDAAIKAIGEKVDVLRDKVVKLEYSK